MDRQELVAAVQRIEWYHRMDLGAGIITPGVAHNSKTLSRLNLPKDLRGKTVLDVGAWDGFYSFEAERRGAERVLATDSYAWSGPGWGTKGGFELARRALGSHVEDQDVDVLDLSPAEVGLFDVVLFLGVLYHMRDPLRALERVRGVTRGYLILETHVDLIWTRRSAAAFYPADELNRDPSNWWGPNPSAVLGMLQAVGFETMDIVLGPRSLPYRAARAAWTKIRERRLFLRSLNSSRLIVPARV
jgi:tRNA (mo5U34)-methyltransferase